MQSRWSHVDDAISSLATAQGPRLWWWREKWRSYCPTRRHRAIVQGSQTTRTGANNAAEQHGLGLGSQGLWPTLHGLGELQVRPSPGSPPSVGSKSGLFQAKIGPVDG